MIAQLPGIEEEKPFPTLKEEIQTSGASTGMFVGHYFYEKLEVSMYINRRMDLFLSQKYTIMKKSKPWDDMYNLKLSIYSLKMWKAR